MPELSASSPAYRTIVCDPPWSYEHGFGGFNQAGRGRARKEVRRGLPYESLDVSQIAALSVESFAATTGANVFLWTTNRYLPDSFVVLTAWGARYRHALIWHKTGANPNTGGIAPTSCEYLLYATLSGGAGLSGKLSDSLLTTKRVANRHSTKPDVWLDFIEEISPPPRVEMFARRNRLGWDTWGNEALPHVELPS